MLVSEIRKTKPAGLFRQLSVGFSDVTASPIYGSLVLAALVVAAAALPLGPYMHSVLTLAIIYFVGSLGYNLIVTISGQFHFGFAFHMAIGGYVYAILTVTHGYGYGVGLAAAFVVSGLVAALVALPTLRFRGDYLAMVTLGFSLIVQQGLMNWESVTNGSMGIPGIMPPEIFGYMSFEPSYLLLLAGAVAVVGLGLYQMLVQSRYGLAWEAVKENSEATEASGIRTWHLQFTVLVIGALYGGIAGVLYACYATIVEPTMASIGNTITLLAIVILGGRSWTGLLIASIAFISLPQVFFDFDIYRGVIIGVVLVLVANLRPAGLSSLKTRPYAEPLLAADVPPSAPREPAGDKAPALLAESVTKKFGGLTAVDNLSCRVERGKIYAVLGPNGAGKTTFFNLLTGALPLTSGSISLRGRDVTGWPAWRIARIGVARTFQNIKLCGSLSALDNILVGVLGRLLFTVPKRADWDRAVADASRALAFVGLEGVADKQASELAYADQKRLEIARAIACRPQLLFLDEPAAGMNPTELRELSQLVAKIRDMGTTVVCIEHNMPFILPIADEVLVMAHGKKLADGTPEAIVNDPLVIDAYLGRRSYRAAN